MFAGSFSMDVDVVVAEAVVGEAEAGAGDDAG